MHMADALLSPAVGATFWAGTLGAIAYCSKKLKENPDEKLIPLMGVLGAFIFAAQMNRGPRRWDRFPPSAASARLRTR